MTRRRWLIVAAVTGAVLILAATLVLVWPWVRVYNNSAAPNQYYRALDSAPATGGRDVMTVAHNAGNKKATTKRALKYGADVVEIDVVRVRGNLAAGRAHALWFLAERLFRGQSLERAWDNASAAKIIKLDLKQNDQGLLNDLVGFLKEKQHDRPVWISTRDADAIKYLRPRLGSNVTLMFSVAFPDAESRVRSDPVLANAIGGISVFRGLVSPSLVSWAHQRRLLVVAWTVNDGDTLDHMLQMHVDVITTQNLAIIEALAT
jgi:glycerophosphoryl diester phosphodiesterase